MTIVFRVQDADGRGPFKPGVTETWLDADPDRTGPPSWMEEFGPNLLRDVGKAGEHHGSACRTIDGLLGWFTATERSKLAGLGYRVVEFRDARVLAESESQVVFGRMKPFAVGAIVRRWP